jgi:DNA-binding NarL/FixJ family response regulator
VLQLIGEGLDNKTIADKFVIAPKTVEYHVTNILKKLDVDTRQKAMLWMLKLSRDLITFGAS